jgi:hypothetical protein
VAAEGQQPGAIALHERLEGGLVAGADVFDELLVRLEPEEGCADADRTDLGGLA